MTWFSEDKSELTEQINSYLKEKPKISGEVHGIVVPHAGYEYSGKIAGKGFSILPKEKKVFVFGPSHYEAFRGLAAPSFVKTPLGEINTEKISYPKIDVPEHSVINQIPFLQHLGFKEIVPIVVGHLSIDEAKELAKGFSKEDAVFVFSTDLSHFLDYDNAKRIDLKTIKIIEGLDSSKFTDNSACGIYPLKILIELCKLKGWKPKLIEYKNSGDVSGGKDRVVGYASMYF